MLTFSKYLNMLKLFVIRITLCCLACFVSCTNDFLDERPRKSLVVPQSLDDLQALLDNSRNLMNVSPFYNIISDGDFRFDDAAITSQLLQIQNLYKWASKIYDETTIVDDWRRPYSQAFYCNVVLDGLKDITMDAQNETRYKNIRGAALFYRALAFYHLSQNFAAPYIPELEEQLLGIPIRLEADVNIRSTRGTLKETYNRIITDLQEAVTLLTVTMEPITRPSRATAYGLLARVYLTMQRYDLARESANACISLRPVLLDYNTLGNTVGNPFPVPFQQENKEILYYSIINNTLINEKYVTVDSVLRESYHLNDLRRILFFNAAGNYKGSYTGSTHPFGGLTLSEVYLIRAESAARMNDLPGALDDLNYLGTMRYKTGTYQPVHSENKDEVLRAILNERRKEMIGRGTRWADLRRLNLEEQYQTTLTRLVNGEMYRLPPNDPKYTFAIPDEEIAGSNIEQNPR